MRFLDANVFIYAYYKPRRRIGDEEGALKAKAMDIIRRISEGEPVATTVVHISEVSNILKRGMSVLSHTELIQGLFMMDNIMIEDATRDSYFAAIDLGRELELTPNDALAVEVMRRRGIDEIYSFDKDFDKVQGIMRLP